MIIASGGWFSVGASRLIQVVRNSEQCSGSFIEKNVPVSGPQIGGREQRTIKASNDAVVAKKKCPDRLASICGGQIRGGVFLNE